MRRFYDFSAAKPNPYVARSKKVVTLRLELEVIAYFKSLAAELGIPYQNLINLYLRDCASESWRPALSWLGAGRLVSSGEKKTQIPS